MAFISLDKMNEQSLVSVVDVYDLASSIGKEFECIIDVFGVQAVTNLMPKVIRSLELLENMAVWAERENAELEESQYMIQRLQRDKMERAQQKMVFEKELEQYEDKWRIETQDLLDVISKLQLENRKLGTALQDRDKPSAPPIESKEEEIKLMTKLKTTIDRQRDHLRCMKKDLDQKNIDNEAMQAQVERLAKVNVELRRKHSVTSRQAHHLIEEKADLQAQLQTKEQEISRIRERLRDDSSESPSSPDPLSPAATGQPLDDRLQHDGMWINLKDPDRPRFTLSELREVILERNELKTKLIEVEEELSVYRPKEEEEEFLPVHGPINKEPYSKLYPDGKPGESGIRKFFSSLFSRTSQPKAPRCNDNNEKVARGRQNGSLSLQLDSRRGRSQQSRSIPYTPLNLKLSGSNQPV